MLSDIKKLKSFKLGQYEFTREIITDPSYNGREYMMWTSHLNKNTWFNITFEEGFGVVIFELREIESRIGHFECEYVFKPHLIDLKKLEKNFYGFLFRLTDWFQSEEKYMERRKKLMKGLYWALRESIPSIDIVRKNLK